MTVRPCSPLGLTVASCLLLGTVLALRLPALPSPWLTVPVLGLGVVAWLRQCGVVRILGAVAVGAAWALIQAQAAMSLRLPSQLQGRDVQVSGRIVDLPQQRADGWRFAFVVDDAEPCAQALLGQRVRLNTYASQPAFQAGERWQFTVRLRRNRPPHPIYSPAPRCDFMAAC